MIEISAWDLWEERVRETPDQRALALHRRTLSYAQVNERAGQIAGGLLEVGIGPGARVAVFLPSELEAILLFVAFAKLGVTAVPLIPSNTTSELAHVLAHSDATWLVSDAAGRARLAELESIPPLIDVAALPDVPPPAYLTRPEPGHPLFLFYTSGSTGRPKGVLLSQAAFATAGRAIAERLGYGPEDTIICPLPLFHAAAPMMNWAPAVAVGATFAPVEGYSATRFWEEVDACSATAALVVPTIATTLLAQPPAITDRLHTLRLLVTHRPLPEFEERFGVEVRTVWGMTETGTLGVMDAPGEPVRSEGYLGHPYPNDAEVGVFDDDEQLPTGRTGEIRFRHPHVMLGYYADPVGTAETLKDGWVCSGDLGWLDNDGALHFAGRIKNMIKRSGENVSAEEVQARIVQHPAVAEVAVVGVPDSIRVEEIYARVVLHADASIGVDELIEWCRAELSEWKIPRYLELCSEPLPRLATHKIDVRAIRASVQFERAYDRHTSS